MTPLKKTLKKMVSLALVSASALGLTGCSDQHQSEEELAQKEIRQVAQDLEKQIKNGFASPEAFNNLAVSCATGADTVEGYSMAKDLSVNEQKAFAACISQTSRNFSEKLRPYIIKDNKKMAQDVLPQIPPANIAAFKNTLKDGISSTEPGGNLPFPVDHYKRNFHLNDEQMVNVFLAYYGFMQKSRLSMADKTVGKAHMFYTQVWGRALPFMGQTQTQSPKSKSQDTAPIQSVYGNRRDF